MRFESFPGLTNQGKTREPLQSPSFDMAIDISRIYLLRKLTQSRVQFYFRNRVAFKSKNFSLRENVP